MLALKSNSSKSHFILEMDTGVFRSIRFKECQYYRRLSYGGQVEKGRKAGGQEKRGPMMLKMNTLPKGFFFKSVIKLPYFTCEAFAVAPM